jgi:hypothetical protein
MSKSLSFRALLLVVTLGACATRATTPQPVAPEPPAPIVVQPPRGTPRVIPYSPLVPINATGDMERQIMTANGAVRVGLYDDGKIKKVVRLVAGADGTQLIDVFVPPLDIPGVPSNLTKFDYQIDPTAIVDGSAPGEFTLVASVNESTRITYHATWTFTWNYGRKAFDVSAPRVEKQDRSVCLPCMS